MPVGRLGEQAGHIDAGHGRTRRLEPLAAVAQQRPGPAAVVVCEVMERDGHLDEALKRLTQIAARALPHCLQHLVHLEEELLLPERDGRSQRVVDGGVDLGTVGVGRARVRAQAVTGGQPACGMRRDHLAMVDIHRAEGAMVACEQVVRRQVVHGGWGGHVATVAQPGESRRGVAVAQAVDHEGRERVAKGKGHRRRHWWALETMIAGRLAVSRVYTDRVAVRHNELDPYGRVHTAVYLRYLTQVAVAASTSVGFGSEWYDQAGVLWLVRRTTFEIPCPARRDAVLELRTWVEDFRRVRSYRRYEVRDAQGTMVVSGRTDWVLVDVESGKPRRVPRELEEAFGVPTGHAAPARSPWQAPQPLTDPARGRYGLRFTDLDSLGHVNNAAYLDLMTEAALDAWRAIGWSLSRFEQLGAVPTVVAGDIEYVAAARYGESVTTSTWCQMAPDAIDVYQLLARADDPAPLVRGHTRWRWQQLADGRWTAPPGDLIVALGAGQAA